jgi:acyl carrier protein
MNINEDEFLEYLEAKLKIPISPDTLFFDGIGIDGLDAITLIDEIKKRFSVDFSNYDGRLYHSSEADVANLFKTFYLFLFNRKRLKKKTFTARHLYKVVKAGHWFPPTNVSSELR